MHEISFTFDRTALCIGPFDRACFCLSKSSKNSNFVFGAVSRVSASHATINVGTLKEIGCNFSQIVVGKTSPFSGYRLLYSFMDSKLMNEYAN